MVGLVGFPDITNAAVVIAIHAGFGILALWRILLALVSIDRHRAAPSPDIWPRYTILAALHDEAAVTPQLIRRLAAIDYPPDRLQAMLLLEAHDAATIAAALGTDRPDWLEVVIVPDGSPRTKPRALNHGLAQATGELITIYDAEDEPHPHQLREAAARFAADTTDRLGCLQAPLRIRPVHEGRLGQHFLGRQFAVEYASLFEVVLPAMARMGLPFPLGGTSNHFRRDAIRDVGGWDAWNVTEDADLGLALWRAGWTLDVISSPTLETAPTTLHDWLPQRTRWIKGFMQTWGVHTRDLRGLGWRGVIALCLTIGGTLAAAFSHAPAIAGVMVTILVAAFAGLPPQSSISALFVLGLGIMSAWMNCTIGARRAGAPYGPLDMLAAPCCWGLLSLAAVHATVRLLTEPFTWDKTAHVPDPVEEIPRPYPVDAVSNDNGLRIRRVSL